MGVLIIIEENTNIYISIIYIYNYIPSEIKTVQTYILLLFHIYNYILLRVKIQMYKLLLFYIHNCILIGVENKNKNYCYFIHIIYQL